MPGLAHFCEHLSFMVSTRRNKHIDLTDSFQGTEQYPRENEYSEVSSRTSH
jgi:secreted Zn-dependent insulinase-like peptidase